MSAYEQNLKVLAKYYPGMDELIRKAKEKLEEEQQEQKSPEEGQDVGRQEAPREPLTVIQEAALNGDPILKVVKEGRTLYLNGRRDPREPAKMWRKSLGKLPGMAPILMMGTGNPAYLKELAEKSEKALTIVVYEPSLELFLKFLELADLKRWMGRHVVVFWVEGLQNMVLSAMRGLLGSVLKYETLNFTRYLILPNYDVLFPEKAVEFVRMCRDIAMSEVLMFNTKNAFSKIMVKNLFANVKYLLNGYKTTQMVTVPHGLPAILVAAGPSLNKNIKDLKAAKGRALIAAVDTAIKPLLREGIVPDLFAIVDPEKPLDLVKMEEIRDVPLLTTLNAAPEVLEYHRGMKFFWDEGYQFAERILQKSGLPVGGLSSGGSVATNLFSLLYMIGTETVILVGQDLAYTGNKSHADGTFQEAMEEQDTSGFIMVEGNYEEKVPTRGDFQNFLNWYHAYIEGCQKANPNFRVINATEGGAKIRNTEIMTLKEAIAQECTQEADIGARFEEISPMLDSATKEWAVGYLKGIPQEFVQMKTKAGKLLQLYKKLDKLCSRRNIDSKEYLSLLKRIKKLSGEIEKASTYQLVTVTLSAAQYIMGNEQFLSEDTIQEEGKEIARKGILYMKNVAEMAELFREMAEKEFADLS